MDRRTFMQSTAGGLALSAASGQTPADPPSAKRPAVIASANGLRATERAMEMLRAGRDPLDAVVAGVGLIEEDPSDHSVGYGGLPNEDGVVQLDASVMHGPTRGAGAVAALTNIKHPSRVAKLVMERTDHVLLVGEGALRFAVAMGFEESELLTPEAREIWMKWKRELSDRDDWISPEERIPRRMDEKEAAVFRAMTRHHGTINCNAISAKGDLSGVTTTSGLAFKIPGRVGDSPIIGAGLYVDNDVGACGSTGRGEANLKTCASFLAVEFMRQGLSPEEAALRALQRIADNTVEPYLLDEKGRPSFDVKFYTINKKGEFAGAAIWSGARFAAHDGVRNELHDCAYLFRRDGAKRGLGNKP